MKGIHSNSLEGYKKDISKIQAYILTTVPPSSKENLPDNKQRSSNHSVVSTKSSMST